MNLSSLVEFLKKRAEEWPDRTAYHFLAEGEKDGGSLTYERLDRRARAIASRLQALGAAGERVLLLYQPGLEFIEGFFGCLYAGAVAVPTYLPPLHKALPRLQAIVSDCTPAAALTVSAHMSLVEACVRQAPRFGQLGWIATDELSASESLGWRDPAAGPETLAFLQYTSGSTSSPRGVMLSHANLFQNLRAIEEAMGLYAGQPSVSWLPPYHDMGLIGMILTPIYTGMRLTFMSPLAFLQRPYRWLAAISRTRATLAGAPNFAYDLCVRKVTPEERAALDLSSWEVAFNGAEPVMAETLDRFADAFAPCGLKREALFPCYGLAEGTLLVTGARKGEGPVTLSVDPAALAEHRILPGTRRLVASGRAAPGLEIAIVDPASLTRLGALRIGEIWVSGPSIARGYWGRSDETESTFRAVLAGGEGPFLRTGDLGFLAEDGNLFVTGRIKDLIIVDGRNHYPQDIELTVSECHPALRPGGSAAFAIEGGEGSEQVIVAAEVRRPSGPAAAPPGEVENAIRTAVWEGHDLSLHDVVLLPPGGIPKTSSGKIQRHACRNQYLARSLSTTDETGGP